MVFFHYSFLIFNCGFTAKVTAHFLLIRSNGEIIRPKHYWSQTNDGIFLIFDPMKVPLLIGHCHLCMEEHFKYAYTPFNKVPVLVPTLLDFNLPNSCLGINVCRPILLKWRKPRILFLNAANFIYSRQNQKGC